VAALMRGAQLTVLSSRHEPFGRVVVESLAVGTPVVAFDSPGPAQILGEDFPELLVPPGDTHALADRIVGLLTDDARRRLSARLTGVAKQFDISRIGPLFEQHLDQPPAHGGLDCDHSLFRFELEQWLTLSDAIPNLLEPTNQPGALHHQSDLRNLLCDQGHCSPLPRSVMNARHVRCPRYRAAEPVPAQGRTG